MLSDSILPSGRRLEGWLRCGTSLRPGWHQNVICANFCVPSHSHPSTGRRSGDSRLTCSPCPDSARPHLLTRATRSVPPLSGSWAEHRGLTSLGPQSEGEGFRQRGVHPPLRRGGKAQPPVPGRMSLDRRGSKDRPSTWGCGAHSVAALHQGLLFEHPPCGLLTGHCPFYKQEGAVMLLTLS